MNSVAIPTSANTQVNGQNRSSAAPGALSCPNGKTQDSMRQRVPAPAPSEAPGREAEPPPSSRGGLNGHSNGTYSPNGKPTQKSRFVAISTILGDDELLLKDFSMTEHLGRLFQMEVELVSHNTSIRFEDVVGTAATVRLQLSDGRTRHFNGLISRFVQTAHERRFARYRATLVPWLWLLTRASDCRIFQDKSVPEIIEAVFRAHQFSDFELRLNGTYKAREYCVQYRETDFAFVSRLMEHEGIHYFFRHENGRHILVLVDANSSLEPAEGCERLPFRPRRHELNGTEETIISWAQAKEVQAGQYAHVDFNFKTPHAELNTNANIDRDHSLAHYEMFDYPGSFTDREQGEATARLRIEEAQCQHEILRAETSVRGIGTGCTFALTGHARADQNREYLVTSATYRIHAEDFESYGHEQVTESFDCSFTAIPLEQEFRPARTTPKPVVHGPQTAFVVGPDGEEIHTDEFGRVKAKFHWDRSRKDDGSASCWIRVSQAAAGKGWGAISLPRVGQEVIVEFLEGDPDRPIITGQVYNAANRVPYPLPENKTISTFKSNSTKDGNGFNEFRFEDKKGEEQVFLHAEKNQDIRVKNDCYEFIGNDRHLIVKKDQIERIENNRHEIVDNDHFESIGKDRHLAVEGKEAKEVGGSRSLRVHGVVMEQFHDNHSQVVDGDHYLRADNIVLESLSNVTLKVGSSFIAIGADGIKISGPVVELEGQAVVKAGAPLVMLNGSSGLIAQAPLTTVKGNGVLVLKGGLVKIN